MKRTRTLTLIIIVCVISATAIALTFSFQSKIETPFTIATTRAHAQLFDNYQALSVKMSREVVVDIYDNEADLMKAVYSGSVDAYSINVFTYLHEFADLPRGKAILGLPAEYYLVTKKEGEVERPKIGIFDETLAFYMLHGAKYATVSYTNTDERLKALHDGLIDFAIISSMDYEEDSAIIVKKMSDTGYNEDLFVLTRPWIESDSEIEHNFVKQLSQSLTQPLKAPDESMLMMAMSELFKDEKIPTRYYYKDLVYTVQP